MTTHLGKGPKMKEILKSATQLIRSWGKESAGRCSNYAIKVPEGGAITMLQKKREKKKKARKGSGKLYSQNEKIIKKRKLKSGKSTNQKVKPKIEENKNRK